ncbi:hypothetical protein [Crocosphaera chwakensis]|uniref:Uncharacterized protein n=1 Tax=Crocosphaera chwakensis CCY0110 TaxID=391612 RepID=A3IQC2_9CHRO|nr:hypothetical protein [Crocosphaera chwakensis]EAZ91462.1 hypothetical protein CY0110_05812 [Crocosphaera chwakensis CCY0110]
MLKKLFGGGKKKEFFLELDEKDKTPASEPKAEKPAPEAKETPEPKAEASQPEATETTEKPAPAKKKAKKKSVKKAAKKQEPKTEIVPTSPALSNGQVAKKEEPKEVEFATKFYMMSTPRRRPGPSLNNFKNMASQVKTRRG